MNTATSRISVKATPVTLLLQLSKTAKIRSAIIPLANFQNGDLTSIVTGLTFKSEKSITYPDNVNPSDLKSVENLPPMGGCMVWWVGGWVGSGQITKNFNNVDLIKIIQF